MRAFEENSQQGGGGALEVAGNCDSQFQPKSNASYTYTKYLGINSVKKVFTCFYDPRL